MNKPPKCPLAEVLWGFCERLTQIEYVETVKEIACFLPGRRLRFCAAKVIRFSSPTLLLIVNQLKNYDSTFAHKQRSCAADSSPIRAKNAFARHNRLFNVG